MQLHKSITNQASAKASAGAFSGKKSRTLTAGPVIQRAPDNSADPNQLFRQEDESSAESTPGQIIVSYPTEASGTVEHSSGISNAYTNTGRAFIENDRVLFEFEYHGSADVTMTAVLTDDWGNGFLSQGFVHWDANGEGGKQYIEFSGFPLRPDGSVMGSCQTERIMTNNDSESTGVHGYEKIYRG